MKFQLVLASFQFQAEWEKVTSRAKLKIFQLKLWLEPARFGLITTIFHIHQFIVQFSIEKQKFFKKYFGEVSSSRILVNKESKAIVHQANLFFSPLSVVSEFFL